MRVYYAEKTGRLQDLNGRGSKYVIFGDWLDVAEEKGDWYIVNWRIWDGDTNRVRLEQHKVRKKECRRDSVLEMIFVDVGQGDGCIVNVPDGERQRTLVVDAGQFGNMHGLLKWRMRFLADEGQLDAAVITHPDQDHYRGFQSIFSNPRINFERVFHNGLLDRSVPKGQENERIGPRRQGYCVEVFPTDKALRDRLADSGITGNYPQLLRTAQKRGWPLQMASVLHGDDEKGRRYLEGFAPSASTASIEIVGPVAEMQGTALRLRALGQQPLDGGFDVGKTKNGHSILLKLRLGAFSVLFGGDLNRSAEDFLLRWYGEIKDDEPLRKAVPKARKVFGADFLKCCHHGSADVTDEFLEAVNPFGFVVSSGDQESHVHPRPELLGLLGKKGRVDRSLVLCTEILRSTPGSKSLQEKEAEELAKLSNKVDEAMDAKARTEAVKGVNAFWKKRFERLVGVYGAINVRTDGETLIVAFRKEAVSRGSPWQVYEYKIIDGEWILSVDEKKH